MTTTANTRAGQSAMRGRLVRYGIPEPILVQWEKRYGGRLLPLQRRAVEEYGLLDGESLLISAPTSSGKTFCGEMALIRAVQKRQKAIFLVPLKAVAEEKYRDFAGCYGALGLKVVIATRDHRESESDLEQGRFDIAVMVYEKFNSLLLTNFDVMGQVGTVVVDELQMIEDETRGAPLELALTKLLHSSYAPQLVALSAVVGEAVDPARWLGCRLLLEKSRPVELQRGVAADGKFVFRCHNSGEIGEESCREGEDTATALFENIRERLESGEQVLVFLKSRHETIGAGRRFSEYADFNVSDEAQEFFEERVGEQEVSALLDNLQDVFVRGVGFHNADLTAIQRTAVEEGYRSGLVRVIFCTTTLSTGINLPAATVFIEAQKYRQQGYSGRPGLEPLAWPEYESMSGRAGRVGLLGAGGHGAGRAVLFASNELERNILWDYYIDKRPEALTSRLGSRSPADIVVDLFSSELAAGSEDVARVLDRSYYATCNGKSVNVDEDIYKVLVEDGFLADRGGNLSATPLGRAVAVTGLTVEGARQVLKTRECFQEGSDAFALYRLFSTPDGRLLYPPPSRRRGDSPFPERMADGTAGDDSLIRELNGLRRRLSADEESRVRLTFLLIDWMDGVPVLDIENKYHLYLGQIDNLARQAGWLLASTASAIRACDRFSSVPDRLERLAFSASTGLPYRMRGMHDDLGEVLFRGEYVRLDREGLTTTGQLIEGSRAVLEKIISSEERLDKIEQKLQYIKEDAMQTQCSAIAGQSVWPHSIVIDGTPVRERFTVRINGRPINLTGKSFKYLVRLAWSRLIRDNGWLYKEDLERGFNQARYLYRLRQEIGRDFFPDWPLYENNRSGYYRLAIDPEAIQVNIEALRASSDYEIRQMAGDLHSGGEGQTGS